MGLTWPDLVLGWPDICDRSWHPRGATVTPFKLKSGGIFHDLGSEPSYFSDVFRFFGFIFLWSEPLSVIRDYEGNYFCDFV